MVLRTLASVVLALLVTACSGAAAPVTDAASGATIPEPPDAP